MSFDDRIRSTVDQALAPLVQQLIEAAAVDREEAGRAAKVAVFEEAEEAVRTRIADAEARVRATVDEQIAQARADDREATAREVRQQLESEAEERMRAALETEMAAVGRLLDSIRGLDGATSLSEVLDALALAAAREAARAAVVVLRNDRIQGWRMSGFGPRDTQPKSIDLTIAEAGVIGIAIGAARPVTTRDGQAAAVGPGFEPLPSDRMGLAVPVIVGGRVVAVVYADAVASGGHSRHVPSSWPELIEVLARHAGRCLEALTNQKAAPRVSPASSSVGSTNVSAAAGPSGAPANLV